MIISLYLGMRKILVFGFFAVFVFISCKYDNHNPAHRFSNFYGTSAEKIVKAIEENDIKTIREEVLNKQVSVSFKDEKYEISLLTLAIANNKKEAFEELLKLGADLNISNSYCGSPLISAIRFNYDCDLFFVEKLLENGADITPMFFDKCNNFTHDPMSETILHYNNEIKIKCGLEILKVLAEKLDNPNLLSQYNNAEDYHESIIYNCINSTKNLSALRYLIVDLKYKVPKKVYIDGTVLMGYHGFKDLKEILKHREFDLKKSEFRRNAKNELLSYLRNGNDTD